MCNCEPDSCVSLLDCGGINCGYLSILTSRSPSENNYRLDRHGRLDIAKVGWYCFLCGGFVRQRL